MRNISNSLNMPNLSKYIHGFKKIIMTFKENLLWYYKITYKKLIVITLT